MARQPILITTPHPIRDHIIVPMNLLILSFCPDPMYCEMMICPALPNPIATNVRKPVTSPPTETALRPTLPSFCPTMIMSTMLYTSCRRLDRNSGVANITSCRGTFPVVKSVMFFSFRIKCSSGTYSIPLHFIYQRSFCF